MVALKKRQETTLAVFLALGLSFLFWIVAENASLFSADVAGPMVEFDESTDIVTFVNDGQVRIVAGKPITDIRSLSMLIAYDAEAVTVDEASVTSSFDINFAAGDAWYATIVINSISEMKKGDELVVMKVVGDAHAIALSDVVVTFLDGTTENLAVSTL